MSPRITVITPAFNVGPYLETTIRSVLAQSFADFEFIIVDDESRDDTLAVARSWAARDARIQVISQKHAGPGAARNAALVVARGEYVSFVDGDDAWLPGFLRALVELLNREPPECVGAFSWSEHIAEDGKSLGTFLRAPPDRYSALKMMLKICPPGNGSCLMLRREPLLTAGLFNVDYISGQDTEMWYRLLLMRSEYYFSVHPEVLVQYRARVGSLSNTQLANRMASKNFVVRTLISRMPREQGARAIFAFINYARRLNTTRFQYSWALRALRYGGIRSLRSLDGLFAVATLVLSPRISFRLRQALGHLRYQVKKFSV